MKTLLIAMAVLMVIPLGSALAQEAERFDMESVLPARPIPFT